MLGVGALVVVAVTVVLQCVACMGRSRNTIAFFHPYCAAAGGGERVLWCARATCVCVCVCVCVHPMVTVCVCVCVCVRGGNLHARRDA